MHARTQTHTHTHRRALSELTSVLDLQYWVYPTCSLPLRHLLSLSLHLVDNSLLSSTTIFPRLLALKVTSFGSALLQHILPLGLLVYPIQNQPHQKK